MRSKLCLRGLIAAAAAATALAAAPGALAAPPVNDNRAAPAPVAAFPATVEGTTVEATVERLDPQVSQCGRVESTVWYRIDLAPDGTVVLDVTGAGLAPVLRVYHIGKSAIDELVCSSAKAGGLRAGRLRDDSGVVVSRPGRKEAGHGGRRRSR